MCLHINYYTFIYRPERYNKTECTSECAREAAGGSRGPQGEAGRSRRTRGAPGRALGPAPFAPRRGLRALAVGRSRVGSRARPSGSPRLCPCAPVSEGPPISPRRTHPAANPAGGARCALGSTSGAPLRPGRCLASRPERRAPSSSIGVLFGGGEGFYWRDFICFGLAVLLPTKPFPKGH